MALVDFIIPTYNRTIQLQSMLASLMCQIHPDWVATVVVDDSENDTARSVINKFDTDKIRLMFTGRRYNDWGHTPRNMGKQASEAKYIVMTGDDNYYVPSFTHEINQLSKRNPAIIYYDMITNNWNNYTLFSTRLSDGFIDMGAFATRNDIAKQINLVPQCFAADHAFIMEFNKRFPKEPTVKIHKILFIHN